MAELDFTMECGMYGMHAKPLKGALWRARFYDRERGQFYAGSADCPWEAIAWAICEREERAANNEHPMMTKSGNETPLQALERIRQRGPDVTHNLDVESAGTRAPARASGAVPSKTAAPRSRRRARG